MLRVSYSTIGPHPGGARPDGVADRVYEDPLLVRYWNISCSLDSLSSATEDAVLPRRGDRGEVSDRTGELGTGESESRLFDSSSVN